ncbi:hypothetical protein PYW08_012192 [Mythimna loreyi]|uniref:Uncharacterized protein n=1 Tax=Mythimna loreyi TaxID=667449 RepID=A0ACC2Q0R2_9NEOP|nr:hypothetical protein PYW08_012192 [Mythimna loreyi]
MSFGLNSLCILVVYAHLIESRIIFLREVDDEPLILDHRESSEEIPITEKPIIYDYTPKKIRSTKKTILQYGRQIFHLGNYEDLRELRSILNPKSISYDYFGELIKSRGNAKKGMGNFVNEIFVISETPERLCFGRECEKDLRKYSKKRRHKKNVDDIDWDQKMNEMHFGNMKRFQIVDNIHNSVRNPKFGSEEFGKKKHKKESKKQKKDSDSDESKASGSDEANSEMSKEKEEKKSKEINISDKKPSTEDSFENSENLNLKSEEVVPKKKSKKKNKHLEPTDDTKRKTIPIEETYFMQGNKIFHSLGRSKKNKHLENSRRSRLEHFMPKRYHWDPSEINDLGYYWFNGPKGMYPEPKVLSK